MSPKSTISALIKIVLIVLFLPFVLIWFVWRKTQWSQRNKWIATAGLVVVFLFLILSSNDNPLDTLDTNLTSSQKISNGEEAKNETSQNKEDGRIDISPEKSSEVPTELRNFVVSYYLENTSCDKEGSEDHELFLNIQDLNEDEKVEYIVAPWEICGQMQRGIAGNGDILVITKNEEGYRLLGELRGNAFKVLDESVGSYKDLISFFHVSAEESSEVLYKFQTSENKYQEHKPEEGKQEVERKDEN